MNANKSQQKKMTKFKEIKYSKTKASVNSMKSMVQNSLKMIQPALKKKEVLMITKPRDKMLKSN